MSYISNEILISLLKQYNISKLVLSSGSRNIPFVSAVETDSDFECFSVIDERNAAFFALGISQQTDEPVAIACTSGTAASNYLSGITEAFYSDTPIVVITFDRSPYSLNQLETQKIDQNSIFTSVCRKSVSLPVVKDNDDIWYCNRLINEALISIEKSKGPVHINVSITGGQNDLVDASINYKKAENTRKIEYISENSDKWNMMSEKLMNAQNILFVMGQTSNISQRTKSAMDTFFEKTKCPLLSDNLSNYRTGSMIFAETTIKALNSKTVSALLPDIIITMGHNFQERIKDIFRANNSSFEHWSIEPSGEVKDVFKNETALFDCEPAFFFEKMNEYISDCDNSGYYDKWKKIEDAAILPDMEYSNFYAIGELSKVIPDNSTLHLSILNATRIMQFYKLNPSIKVFSNVNAFGIDGCLPAFMGQAFLTDELAFLVTGDLSFFYGMNALSIKHRKNNIRILLINNGGGAEFHIMPDSNSIPTIDLHIGAAHSRTAKEWAVSSGYEYLYANNKETFSISLEKFIRKDNDSPVLFEVFTDMKHDGEHLLSVYRYLEKQIEKTIIEME